MNGIGRYNQGSAGKFRMHTQPPPSPAGMMGGEGIEQIRGMNVGFAGSARLDQRE
ncbi:MAG: hypothetical protein ACKOZT_05880 [Cyanobium sp.]